MERNFPDPSEDRQAAVPLPIWEPVPDAAAKRCLRWQDFALAAAGIVLIYAALSVLTGVLASVWMNERGLLYLNAFLTQLSFGGLVLVLGHFRRWTWADFGWRFIEPGKVWASVLKLYGMTWIFNVLYVVFLYAHRFTPPMNDAYTQLLTKATWPTFLLNLGLAGVLAPVIEETLFRGIIFGALMSYCGKWIAGAISAAMFSGLHMQAYGFVPRFILGLVLAHLYARYRSLYPAVALHALNNLVATSLLAGYSP